MSSINNNVLHLREGTVWELPKTFESLDQVFNVITIVWKAKVCIIPYSSGKTISNNLLAENDRGYGGRCQKLSRRYGGRPAQRRLCLR